MSKITIQYKLLNKYDEEQLWSEILKMASHKFRSNRIISDI